MRCCSPRQRTAFELSHGDSIACRATSKRGFEWPSHVAVSNVCEALDGGILMTGAANAVRGSKAPAEELSYIASHAAVCSIVVGHHAPQRPPFTLA